MIREEPDLKPDENLEISKWNKFYIRKFFAKEILFFDLKFEIEYNRGENNRNITI
jgi:hypothetical protein